MYLKSAVLGLLLLIVINGTLVTGSLRDERDAGSAIGNMINKLVSKLFGTNTTTTGATPTTATMSPPQTDQPEAKAENTTTSSNSNDNTAVSDDETINKVAATENKSSENSVENSTPMNEEVTKEGNQSSTEVLPKTSNGSTSPGTISTATTKTTTYPVLTTQPATPYYLGTTTPGICMVDPFLDQRCTVPAELDGVSFWDLYELMFSTRVVEVMMELCNKGEWCLRDKFYYWNSLIDERVGELNSEVASSMCTEEGQRCVASIPGSFRNCSDYEQMHITAESVTLVCKLLKNPKLTPKKASECYERTLQALHVTLADILRGAKEGEETVSHTGDICQSPEARMTENIICIINSCPGEEDAVKSFPPWAWFARDVEMIIDECKLNRSECVGLLQPGKMSWLQEHDTGLMIGVAVVSLATILMTVFIGCTFWRRHRRSVVLKDGYQQLLNEGDES